MKKEEMGISVSTKTSAISLLLVWPTTHLLGEPHAEPELCERPLALGSH